MAEEYVRIEVGSKLLWKYHTYINHSLKDACVVTVTRIYKDGSFRVEDANGKDKGRFKAHPSFDGGRPVVKGWGNEGWGITSGQVYPLPKTVTDKTLKAEMVSAKEAKAKKQNKEQAERDTRHAEIIKTQAGRLNERTYIDKCLARTTMVNRNGTVLTIIFHSKSKTLWDWPGKSKSKGEYEGVKVSAQAFGKRWSEDDEPGWAGSVTRDGDTLQEALEAVVISLW